MEDSQELKFNINMQHNFGKVIVFLINKTV